MAVLTIGLRAVRVDDTDIAVGRLQPFGEVSFTSLGGVLSLLSGAGCACRSSP